jgi:DNA-binding MarR family transcriptional regulator
MGTATTDRSTARPPRAADPRSTHDSARELAVALFDLAWLLPRTLGAEERQPDPLPRSELEVMRMLGRRPGCGVAAVARELGLQASNVSASVRSLVHKGLVERRSSVDDQRQVRLYLTPRAKTSRRARERRWGQDLGALLDQLPAAERRHLLAAAPALVELARRVAEPRAD